jgi:DNA-directed RNA polymerase subunit N (RpoN/RPB10)
VIKTIIRAGASMRTDNQGMMNGLLKIAGRGKSAMARSPKSSMSINLHKICRVNLNLSSPEWPKPFNCGGVSGIQFEGFDKKRQPENHPQQAGDSVAKEWPEYRKLVSRTESKGKEPRDGWRRWRGKSMGYRPMRELGFFEHYKRDRFRCQK